MDDFSHLDGLAQAALVASKQVSAAELLESAIARAEAVNPALNFIAQKLYGRARNAPVGRVICGTAMCRRSTARCSTGTRPPGW